MTRFSGLYFPGVPFTEIIKAADAEIARLTERLDTRDAANKGLRYDLNMWRGRSNSLSMEKAKLRRIVNRGSQAYRECRDREYKMIQERHDQRAVIEVKDAALIGRRRTCELLNKDLDKLQEKLAQAVSNATLYQEAHLATADQRGVLVDKLHKANKTIKKLTSTGRLALSQRNAEQRARTPLQKVIDDQREQLAGTKKQISNWAARYDAEKRTAEHQQKLLNNQRERIEALLKDRRELAACTTNVVFGPTPTRPLGTLRETRLEQIIEDQRQTITGFMMSCDKYKQEIADLKVSPPWTTEQRDRLAYYTGETTRLQVMITAADKTREARRLQAMEQGIEINCLCRKLQDALDSNVRVRKELKDFKSTSRFSYNNVTMENKDLRNKVRELKENPQLLYVPSDDAPVVVHHYMTGPLKDKR